MAIFLEDYYSQELKGELILQQSQQLLCYNFSIEKKLFFDLVSNVSRIQLFFWVAEACQSASKKDLKVVKLMLMVKRMLWNVQRDSESHKCWPTHLLRSTLQTHQSSSCAQSILWCRSKFQNEFQDCLFVSSFFLLEDQMMKKMDRKARMENDNSSKNSCALQWFIMSDWQQHSESGLRLGSQKMHNDKNLWKWRVLSCWAVQQLSVQKVANSSVEDS